MEEWLDLAELVDKVQEFLEIGLFEEAKALLDQYSEIFENEWEIYFLYSRLHSETNNHQQAISYLLRGLHIDNYNIDCLLGLFYAYTMINQTKRGGTYLLKAEKHHPKNEQVLVALIWYYAEVNDPDKAISYFEQLKRENISNPEAFRNVGIAYSRLGCFEDAEQCFRIALEHEPNLDETRDLLADHLIFMGKTEDAISIYKDALKESPRNIRLMSRLISCLLQNTQLDQASTMAKESIRLYPNSPAGYVDLAYVCLNQNNTEEAISIADKAISIAPIDAEAYRVKAIALSEQGEFSAAKTNFEKALSLDDDTSEILRDYYHHLRCSGSHEEMLCIINRVIEAESPHCTEEYWFLADYYREIGQNLTAFHYLHKAYKTMPAEKELIPPMLDILLEKGHTRYTFPIFARYVQKNGWNSVINDFSKHKHLKNKWSQEGLRFLRFFGQNPIEFRKYIFRLYFSRFVLLTFTAIFISLTLPIHVLFGYMGVLTLGVSYALVLGLGKITSKAKKRATALPKTEVHLQLSPKEKDTA